MSEVFTRATRSVVVRKRVKEARRNLGREPLTIMRVSKTTHDAENWKAVNTNSLENARSPQNLRRKKSAPQISSLVRQPFSEEKPKTLKADCGALCPPGFTPLHAISRHFHRRTALARDPAEIINKLDRC